MIIKNLSKNQALFRTIAHEVAHWVVSRKYGHPVNDKITITSINPEERVFAGLCDYKERYYANNYEYIMSVLAGPASDLYLLSKVVGEAALLEQMFDNEDGPFKVELWSSTGDLGKLKKEFEFSNDFLIEGLYMVIENHFYEDSPYQKILDKIEFMFNQGIFDPYINNTEETLFTIEMPTFLDEEEGAA